MPIDTGMPIQTTPEFIMFDTLTAPPDTAQTPSRVDLYAPIHKALRSFMCDTLCRVGRIDVDDAAELRDTLAQCESLLELCAGHVHHENEFMHPAIEVRTPLASRRIADEHDEHLESIAELRAEVETLRRAGAAQRAMLALRLYRHLALFVAANFQHMHVEESAHNAALWATYDDAELMQLHQRILDSITPEEHLLVARWMLPALNPAERADTVRGMREATPPEALVALMAQVRPHMDEVGRRKLARDTGVAA